MLIELNLKRTSFFLLLFLFCVNEGFTQSVKLSTYEWRWAFWHPIAAYKTKRIAKKCEPVYASAKRDSRLDAIENGGRVDAFRHLFYMAAFAQKIKINKVRSLGKAHEKNNYRQFLKNEREFGGLSDSLSSVMDLSNNEIGMELGVLHKNLSLAQLSEVVLEEILAGKALILMMDKKGHFLTCEGKIIDLKLYSGKWSVPKCLVKSNYLMN